MFFLPLTVGDVKSLYLCVDLDKALQASIRIAVRHSTVMSSSVHFFSLPGWPDELARLIRACHSLCFFRFTCILFRHISGLGMGMVDSVVLANLFMVEVDEEWKRMAEKFGVSVELYGRDVPL